MLIALSNAGTPKTSWTAAIAPIWSAAYSPPSYPAPNNASSRPLRYLGNVQFRGADGMGLAVGAANWLEQGLLNALVQMDVTFNPSAQQYDVSAPVFAGPTDTGSTGPTFFTGRHFGLAQDRGSGQLVMVWSNGQGSTQLYVARKSKFESASAFGGSLILPPWPGMRVVRSSIDVAARSRSSFTFYPQYTYIPARFEVGAALTTP